MTKYFTKLALVAALGIVSAGFAAADEWDKKTTVTTDEAMQLPTTILQPGTYVIRLLNSNSDRHVVQIFDKDEKHLITTILAIPNERMRPTGKSVFVFWEVPAGHPKALRAWFYPGDNFGQEFAYPKDQATRITADNRGSAVPTSDYKAADLAVSAGTAATSSDTAAPSSPTSTAPAPVEVAAVPQQSIPAPPVTSSDERQRAVPTTIAARSDADSASQSTQPDSLPGTASNLPLIGLLGLLAVGGALALNVASHRA